MYSNHVFHGLCTKNQVLKEDIMFKIQKISSLEEISTIQVAINLCQDDGFREIALRLEKPTYGVNIRYDEDNDIFVSDSEKLSALVNMMIKNDESLLKGFIKHCRISDAEKVRQWESSVDEHCVKLLRRIPFGVKQHVHIWMNRIALEYLSYSRRLEELFGVTGYYLMDVLSLEDWTSACRLDEKKLALKFFQDERLTISQRYRIACAYCLPISIRQLWERLTLEEKQLTIGNDEPGPSTETNELVLLWSNHMDKEHKQEKELPTEHLWADVADKAMSNNPIVLRLCWENIKLHIQQDKIVDLSLFLAEIWTSGVLKNSITLQRNYKEFLITNSLFIDPKYVGCIVRVFCLPSHFSELFCFLLSQINDEQQLNVFRRAYSYRRQANITECFLDWPYLDEFLPTMNRLWGIIPNEKYERCLMILVSKYNAKDDRENFPYDYGDLLEMLWEKTPPLYKQYVFRNDGSNISHNVGRALLTSLLGRSPFGEKDRVLFENFFYVLAEEERRHLFKRNPEIMNNIICLLLIREEKFVNWLLEQSLPNEDIPTFKRELIQSDGCVKICLENVDHNCENLELLIDWAFVSEREKEQFRYLLREKCSERLESVLCAAEFDKAERYINFCVSWELSRRQSESDIIQDVNEVNRCIKKDLLKRVRINVYYNLVFNRNLYRNLVFNRYQSEIKQFHNFFGLSSEEILKLKEDTLFSPDVNKKIQTACQACPYLDDKVEEDLKELAASLCFCVADEKMVKTLREKVEKDYIETLDEQEREKKRKNLYSLCKQIDTFRMKNVLDEGCAKEKRSSTVVEDESSALRKRVRSGSQQIPQKSD